mmetsp:Transcript_7086/g.20943  ORF Transcript_7086/g.20943 Transcript_7086/m.20943 type:complete len:294 (+) Transcript_7086:250-1131(+)
MQRVRAVRMRADAERRLPAAKEPVRHPGGLVSAVVKVVHPEQLAAAVPLRVREQLAVDVQPRARRRQRRSDVRPTAWLDAVHRGGDLLAARRGGAPREVELARVTLPLVEEDGDAPVIRVDGAAGGLCGGDGLDGEDLAVRRRGRQHPSSEGEGGAVESGARRAQLDLVRLRAQRLEVSRERRARRRLCASRAAVASRLRHLAAGLLHHLDAERLHRRVAAAAGVLCVAPEEGEAVNEEQRYKEPRQPPPHRRKVGPASPLRGERPEGVAEVGVLSHAGPGEEKAEREQRAPQ